MNKNILWLSVIVFSLFTISCKNADKVGKLIPMDAGIVVHLNTNSLSKKLSWDEIRTTDWFRNMYNDSPDTLAKQLMDNPESSGIDTKADLVFFSKKEGNGGYFAFTGLINDGKAFEAFNKKILKNAATTRSGEYNNMNMENKGIVFWNDKRFIYLMNTPMGNMPSMAGDNQNHLPTNFSADSLRGFAKQLFELDGDNSLGKDDKFSDMIKEEGDVHMYLNAGQLYGDIGGGMLSMMKLNILFENNISASTISFDNGKVTIKSKQYYGKELANVLDRYPSKSIDKDLLDRIPSKDVIAVFAMNYPPEGLKEFMRVIGVDGMVNGYLGRINYSMDEFIKANKGDLILAISDFSMVKQEIDIPDTDQNEKKSLQHTANRPDVKVLFATSINDKAAFDKLINSLKGEMDKIPQGKLPPISYSIRNNWFAAGNSQDHVNQFLAGGKNNQPFTEKLSGHSYGGYLNIQRLLKSIQGSITDSSNRGAMDASVSMWEDAFFTGNEYKNGMISSEGVVNLVDKNTNSLKQLNQYANTMSNSFKKQQQRWNDIKTDSVQLTPRGNKN